LLLLHSYIWSKILTPIELLRQNKLLICFSCRILGSLVWKIIWAWIITNNFRLVLNLSCLFLSKLLLALNCLPIYSIPYRFSTSTKYGKWIKPWICSKDLFPIFNNANVINTFEWFSLLIKVFYSGFVFTSKHDMEF
jgi:hypothetical protein